MKLSKFQIACGIGFLVLIIIALIDIQGVNLIGYNDYTKGNFNNSVWTNFLLISLILMSIPALLYFNLYRKDKSEALAVFLVPFIGFWFMISDILYFWLQKKAIPSVLPWINNHPVTGLVGKTLGYSEVTSQVVLITAIFGLILIFFTTKFLKEKF